MLPQITCFQQVAYKSSVHDDAIPHSGSVSFNLFVVVAVAIQLNLEQLRTIHAVDRLTCLVTLRQMKEQIHVQHVTILRPVKDDRIKSKSVNGCLSTVYQLRIACM